MASPGPAEAVTPTPAMSAWNPNTSDARTAVESAAYGIFNGCSINGQGRNRTAGTRIFSPLLYRLSYLPDHSILEGIGSPPKLKAGIIAGVGGLSSGGL